MNYQAFSNNTVMELSDEGYWKVVTSIVQKVGDTEGVRTRKIATMGISRDQEVSFKTAIKALEATFASNHKNLFDERNELEDEQTDIVAQDS